MGVHRHDTPVDERDTQIESEDTIDAGTGSDIDLDDATGGLDTRDVGGFGSDALERGTDEEHTDDDSWLSSAGLLAAILLSAVGLLAVGTVPYLGFVGELLGIAAGTFVLGVAGASRRYLEAGIAGGAVGLGSVLVSNLGLGLLALGPLLVTLGLVGGVIAGIGGHYFGRDLRDGLTRDLE